MNSSRTLAIIQARMGSSRLPGKAMLPIIDGKGALELMLERVRRSSMINTLAVATTTAADDQNIADFCEKSAAKCFRGSEQDVLDRFYQCARELGGHDTIVRLTGDCPLHDHRVIDQVIAAFHAADHDYLSNVAPPTWPDGLDVEVFSFNTLFRAWREAELRSEREHVTLYVRNHPERFSLGNVRHDEDFSAWRWTLDEPADFAFIQAVYRHLYHEHPDFSLHDVLAFLRENPATAKLNQGIARNEGLSTSLANDGKRS